jgi:uncharacterized membrane protein YjjP (DUF1212 family)
MSTPAGLPAQASAHRQDGQRPPLGGEALLEALLNTPADTSPQPAARPEAGAHPPLSRETLLEVLVIAMRAGQIILESGANTARVEETISHIGTALGAELMEVYATPTGVIATGMAGAEHRTRILRISRSSVDLSRVAAVLDVSRRAAEGWLDRQEVRAELEEIAHRPREYSHLLTTAAVAVACGSAAVLFGGGWRESLVALLAAGAAHLPRNWLTERIPNRQLVAGLVAAIGASLGLLLVSMIQAPLPAPALLGSVLFLVPGLLMVSSTSDLFRGDTISGLARAASAALMLVSIGAGVWLVLLLSGAHIDLRPGQPPGLPSALLAGLSASGFGILFNIPRRALLFGALVGALAYLMRLLALQLGLPLEAATFLGGTMIGLCGEQLARLRRLPTTLFTVPGFIMLVPGTIAFRSLIDFVNARYDAGIQNLVLALLLTGALAAGLGTVSVLARLRQHHGKPSAKP